MFDQPPNQPAFTSDQLLFAANALFDDVARSTPSILLLSHFSTTSPVVLEHTPPLGYGYPVQGPNAVRSYFDLIALHWTQSGMHKRAERVFPDTRQVAIRASVRWTWRASGKSWTEDFLMTLDFDEFLKVTRFVARTESGAGTCLMRVTDPPPQ